MNVSTGGSLAGLSVVVTRPAAQAVTLCSQLHEVGGHVHAIPLIAIEPLGNDSPSAHDRIQQQLANLHRYQHAIFISLNAAEQALSALRAAHLAWPAHTQAHGIGRSTAEWLSQQSIPADYPPSMNSEGMLAMPAFAHAAGQSCLIFRGEGGRETLAEGLRTKGMTVAYCELYRRCLPADAKQRWHDWLQQHPPSTPAVVCVNSIETLDNLRAVDEHCTQHPGLVWLVPGDRVATAAQQRGFHPLIVSPDATDTSVLVALAQWLTHAPKPHSL